MRMKAVCVLVALAGAVETRPQHHLKLLNHATKTGQTADPEVKWGADTHKDEFSNEYDEHDTSHVQVKEMEDDKKWMKEMDKHGTTADTYFAKGGKDYLHDKQPPVSSAALLAASAAFLALA